MHEKEREQNNEVRYLTYNRDRFIEDAKPKNVCKIGICNKKNYVATLSMIDGKEVLTVHTLIEKEGDVIETLEGEGARRFFIRLMFF